MKNPFMKDGYMLPVASINSIYIDHTLVSDLFRLELIVKDCILHKEMLRIHDTDHREILKEFQNALLSHDEVVSKAAKEIAHKYGKRLAQMILTLKRPSELSIENRKNWSKVHWDYWKKIKKIIFVGGVSLPALTKIFFQDIKKMLKKEQLDIEISFIEGSINLGTEALSKKVKSNEALLFDFGQTNIKRRHHSKDGDDIVLDMIMPCIESKYLYYKEQTNEELLETARELDVYIQDVILRTIKETMFEGHTIYIAMANYIYKGRIYPNRGGYAKLGLLEECYEEYLSNTLSERYGHRLDVRLFHDTTAVSYFFEHEKDTAVISIGTAFGVAFVEGYKNDEKS